MIRWFRSLLLGCACLFAAGVRAADGEAAPPAAETTPVYTYSISTARNGSHVDWQAGQLEAVGRAYALDGGALAMQQARVTAYDMVTTEARQGLLALAVDGTTTLAALQTTEEMRRLIDGLLANLVYVDERWSTSKRTYTVVGVLPLYGERGVSAVGVKIAALATPIALGRAQLTLPRPIPRGATPQRGAAPPYTGVIINADKVLLTPSLFPRLLRFDGKEFWGASQLSPEAITNGPVRYVRNLQTARKQGLAGKNPLVLEAVGTGLQCHPIFNVEDIVRVLTEHKKMGLLDNAPLIITLGQK